MLVLFPLAAALSGGSVDREVAIALLFNITGAIAAAAGLRYVLHGRDDVPAWLTAWPWEPEAYGLPRREDDVVLRTTPRASGPQEETKDA